MRPLVAIVGRPNVGKSMLFNKLCGQRLSIVEDTPGVTRDRLYAQCEWRNRTFDIVDTGGIEPGTDDQILSFMREQAEIAISTATVIVFVCDVKTGMTASDQEVANMLLRSGKPVVLAVNKADQVGRENPDVYEFYNLGLGDPIAVSAVHGHGTGDLLDACFEYFPPDDEEEEDDDTIKVAIIGKPNVGKSSLVNRILGQERVIVSNVAGTTRDAVDSVFENEKGKFLFIDTAGMRKKSLVHEDIEYYSLVRGLQAIDRADVCLLVVDSTVGVTEQDQKVANMAIDRGCGLVLLLNKWDLIETQQQRDEVVASIDKRLAFAPWVPTVNISALTGRAIDKVLALAVRAAEARAAQLRTAELNDLLAQIREGGHTRSEKGRRLKIQYATQTGSKPPVISFWCNAPDLVDDNFERFVENRLRERFDLIGTPVRLKFRKKSEGGDR